MKVAGTFGVEQANGRDSRQIGAEQAHTVDMAQKARTYSVAVGAVVAALLVSMSVGPAAVAGPTGATTRSLHPAACTKSWSVVKSPNRGTGANALYGVSADSPTDAWAVGYQTTSTGVEHTLIERWDGVHWTVVPSPNTGSDFLYAVSADSPTDAWAVGGTNLPPTGNRKTLVEHWNGLTWSISPALNTKKANDDLTSVVAFASNDVIAVGTDGTLQSTANLPLAEVWNGASWSKGNPPSPVGSTDSTLSGIGATSPSDVWAVGSATVGIDSNPIIEHSGGGGAFSLVPSPALGLSFGLLGGVAGISTTDAWAVGQDGTSTGRTLAEHWDGVSWSVVATPNPGIGDNELTKVAAVGTSDVWASGYADNGSVWQTLVEHWDGSTWSAVSTPSPGTGYDVLWGIATSGTDGFAVGSTQAAPGSPNQTLVERACGI